MAESVVLTGDKALSHRLSVAERGLSNLSPTHRRTASVVANAARSRAPKRTGRLAASIRAYSTSKAAVIVFSAPYAGPIHWGWRTRPDRARGWRGGPISPNPFAAQAAQATESGWVSLYQRAVNNLLNGETQL